MKKRKSLKQLLIYYSREGSLGGAAEELKISKVTLWKAVSGEPVGKSTAKKISAMVNGEYSVAEMMGVE